MLMVKDEEFNTILHEVDYPISCDMIIPYTVWINTRGNPLKSNFKKFWLNKMERKERRGKTCAEKVTSIQWKYI